MKKTRKQKLKQKKKEKNKQKKLERQQQQQENNTIKKKTEEKTEKILKEKQPKNKEEIQYEELEDEQVVFDQKALLSEENIISVLQQIRKLLFSAENNEYLYKEIYSKLSSSLLTKLSKKQQYKSGQIIQVPYDYITPQIKELRLYVNNPEYNKPNKEYYLFEKKVKLIMLIDEIYFKVYYHNITEGGFQKKEFVQAEKEDVTDPLTFLKKSFSKKQLRNSFKSVLAQFHQSENKEKFLKLYEYDEKGKKNTENENYLLELLHQRQKETFILFQNSENQNIQISALKEAIKENKHKIQANDSEFDAGPRGPPISYPLLQQWRENCRDWGCWLYSYSVLNTENLQLVCDNLSKNILEMGAGTGYISDQIKKHNKDINIVPFDLFPTSDTQGSNQYHRNSPEFMEVQKGGTEILNKGEYLEYDLILSYPPPKNNMAYDCIKNFKGKRFAYIGEWRGVTANNKFEAYLIMSYKLVKQVQIPTFSDQTCDLTIWERREEKLDKVTQVPDEDQTLKCSKCGVAASQQTYLYKCMLCRENHYCSDDCLYMDKMNHTDVHMLRGVNFDMRQLNLKKENMFTQIQPIKLTQRFKTDLGQEDKNLNKKRRNNKGYKNEEGFENNERKQFKTE